jgi:hypothetical protein
VANELIWLIDRINNAIQSERTMRIAVSSVLARHKPRIFEKGLDGSGAKIGTYKTNPISISKKNQAKQTGKTYFKGGYAEYKSDIGKNPGFVNLRNTDQMMNDYGLVLSGGKFGLGFQNNTNYDKSQWMQDKYDKSIFDHTQDELDLLADVLTAEINKAI